MNKTFSSLIQILRLKGQQVLNRHAQKIPFVGSSESEEGRSGTPRTSGGGRVLSLLVLALFIFIVPVGYMFLLQLQVGINPGAEQIAAQNTKMQSGHIVTKPDGWRGRSSWEDLNQGEKEWVKTIDRATESAGNRFMLSGLSYLPGARVFQTQQYMKRAILLLLLVMLTKIFFDLAQRHCHSVRLDQDVEWMMTMPVSTVLVYGAKVVERTFLDVVGWIVFSLFYGVLLWLWGYTWLLLPLVVICVLLTNFVSALVTFAVDLFLYSTCTRYVIDTISAGFHVLCMAMFLGFLYLLNVRSLLGDQGAGVFKWADSAGGWLLYNPFGLLLSMLQYQMDGKGMGLLGLFLFEYGLLLVAWYSLVQVLSSHGLEIIQSSRDREPGQTKSRSGHWLQRSKVGAIVQKELQLLWRQKNILLQMMLPLFLFGVYWLTGQIPASVFHDPKTSALLAFGMGAYLLVIIAPLNVFHEKKGLWLNYTVAQSPLHFFFIKSLVWSVVGILYSSAFYGYSMYLRGQLTATDAGHLAFIVPALLLFGLCGAGFGIIGADPHARREQDRMRKDLMMVYFCLGGLLVSGLFAPAIWTRIVSLIVFAGMTLAIVEKARSRAGFLLDPVEEPPRILDVSDGLIYIGLFFFAQLFATMILSYNLPEALGPVIVLSYFYAGIVTVFIAFYLLWRTGTSLMDQHYFFDTSNLKQIPIYGISAGLLLAGVGICYLWVLQRLPIVELPKKQLPISVQVEWIYVLAVIGAPIFEELLFRGLLFNGLRSSFTFWPAALISAALFAVVHPAISFVPVFLAGLVTAYVFDRTKNLVTPMIVHAIYNLIIVFVSV